MLYLSAQSCHRRSPFMASPRPKQETRRHDPKRAAACLSSHWERLEQPTSHELMPVMPCRVKHMGDYYPCLNASEMSNWLDMLTNKTERQGIAWYTDLARPFQFQTLLATRDKLPLALLRNSGKTFGKNHDKSLETHDLGPACVWRLLVHSRKRAIDIEKSWKFICSLRMDLKIMVCP